MSFTLTPGKPVHRELKRIVRDQLRRARKHLDEDAEQHVHQARKSVKKTRAVLQWLRQANAADIRKSERRLRDVGRTLSELRDADAVIATLDRVHRAYPQRLSEHTHRLMQRDLARAKARGLADARKDGRLRRAADTLRAVRRSAATWAIPSIDPLDIPAFVKASYRAARKAMRRAKTSSRTDDLHRWRKRVKTLWYQLRLLEESLPALRQTVRGLDTLETKLGEHHDLSVLEETIASVASQRRSAVDQVTPLTALATPMQRTLRRDALRLGKRLLARKPKAFSQALRVALSGSLQSVAHTGRKSTAA